MKIIKMPISGLNPTDLNVAAERFLTELAANATDFPAAPVSELATNRDALSTKICELGSLANQLAAKRLEIAATCGRVRAAMNQLGEWMEGVTKDPGKLAKVATLRAARTPSGPMPRVTRPTFASTVAVGVVVPRWASLYKLGVRSYEVQSLLNADPTTGVWVQQPSVIKAKCTLTGLTSGARIWVRVRAIGTSGPGGWSEPASRIVP